MIGFQLSNGEVITLSVKTKFEFKLVSSLFDDDIPAAHSTNFTVSDVDGNYQKLGFPNLLDQVNRTIVHSGVQMTVSGRPQYSGKLFVKRNRETSLTCFYIPNGLAADILNKRLTDVNYGSDVVLGSTTSAIVTAASAYVSQNYPDVNFNFPTIYAPNFYKVENAIAWRCAHNLERWDPEKEYAIGDYVKLNNLGNNSLQSVYRCIAPTSEFQSPISHPAKWELENGNCLINNWNDAGGEFRSNDLTGIATFNKHVLSPQLYTKFVLQRIAQTYGYRVIGEFMEDPNTDQSMTHNNVGLDRGEQIYYVRANNDGIGPTACNNYAGSGQGLTYSDLNSSKIVFNDETTSPNEDADGIYDGCDTSEYTIQNAGVHTVTFNLEITTNTSGNSARCRIYFPYNSTAVNAGDGYNVIPAGYTGLFQYTYSFEASASDVGEHFYAEILFQDSGVYMAFEAVTSYMIVENVAANNMNRYNGTIDLSQHVPDELISNYFIGVKRRHNLNVIIDPSQRVIRFDYARKLLDRDADDYTDILQNPTTDFKEAEGLKITENFNADVDVNDGEGITIANTADSLAGLEATYYDYELNQVVYCKSDNTLYRLGLKDSVRRAWFSLGNYYPDFIYGDGARTLEMIGAPINMETIWHEEDAITVPRFDIEGSSVLFGKGRTECPLMFSFWHGLKDSQNGEFSYPFCSPHPYEPDGTAISNRIDLRFADDDVSVWNEHKDWVRRVDRTVKITSKAFMNIKDVFEWTFRNPIRLRYQRLIRESLVYEIDQDENLEAEIEAYKVNL